MFSIEQLKGKLVVSCQALPDEPLYSSFIMGRMAVAAKEGGAACIRCNTTEDILEIKKTTGLPVIGIIKAVYPDSEVYITPTMAEVADLVACHCEIIACDATRRMRPGQLALDRFFQEVRQRYPEQLFMADCSTYEEGMHAAELGFDLIGTTMSGYTQYTDETSLPNFHMIERLSRDCGRPVIAEGGIWSPEDLQAVMQAGAFAAVVGSAISRPQLITKRFADAINRS